MSAEPKLNNYVSEIDQFLNEFDQSHPNPTLSQQKEQAKYRRIFALRDDKAREEKSETHWDGF